MGEAPTSLGENVDNSEICSTKRSNCPNPGVKRKILGGEEPKDDGSFWMQWEDFVVFWKDVQAT